MKAIGIVRKGFCPWCEGTERLKVTCKLAFTNTTNHYLDEVARKLDLPSDELIASMTEWECSACGTHYLDPWLNESLGALLFQSLKSTHRAGWGNFLQEISVKASRQFNLAQGFLQFSINRGIKFKEYWELGCPFFGFLIPFHKMQKDKSSRNLAIDYQNFLIEHTARNSFGKRKIYRSLEIVSFKLQLAYTKVLQGRSKSFNRILSDYNLMSSIELGHWKHNEEFFGIQVNVLVKQPHAG